jgi:hypothetical protein
MSSPSVPTAGLGLRDFQWLLDRFMRTSRERLAEALVAIALFGSAARGTAGPRSDLDLLVVHAGERRRVSDALLDAILDLRQTPECAALRSGGIEAEPYPLLLSLSQLAGTPWILLDVADHGVILHDPLLILRRKLDDVRRRLSQLGSRKVRLADGSWYWDLKPGLRRGEMFEL